MFGDRHITGELQNADSSSLVGLRVGILVQYRG